MGRRALVAANWKMNGQKAQIAALSHALKAGLAALTSLEVVICPPSVYLAQAQDALQGSKLALGAQNLHPEDKGAFTGEVSAPMLKDLGCRYVIVGHSERRKLCGENDAAVAAKFAAAQRHGLVPILCVGESAAQNRKGTTQAVVGAQLDAVLDKAGIAAFSSAVLAYEPVWAIGRGRAATPEIAQEVLALIRERLARHDSNIARSIRLLYGGSVSAANAKEFAIMPDIDGVLVGGASLIAEEFIGICERFNTARKGN